MADLAVVFHWAPSEMNPMSPEEIARWHAKAMARWPETDGTGNG